MSDFNIDKPEEPHEEYVDETLNIAEVEAWYRTAQTYEILGIKHTEYIWHYGSRLLVQSGSYKSTEVMKPICNEDFSYASWHGPFKQIQHLDKPIGMVCQQCSLLKDIKKGK